MLLRMSTAQLIEQLQSGSNPTAWITAAATAAACLAAALSKKQHCAIANTNVTTGDTVAV